MEEERKGEGESEKGGKKRKKKKKRKEGMLDFRNIFSLSLSLSLSLSRGRKFPLFTILWRMESLVVDDGTRMYVSRIPLNNVDTRSFVGTGQLQPP